MQNFKKWIEAQQSTNQGFSSPTVLGLNNAEQEYDPYIPDQNHVLLATNFSKKIQGFFPTFRQSIKTRAVLNAFSTALKMGLPKNSNNPFDYNQNTWLNPEITQFMSMQLGLTPAALEPYAEQLKRYFTQIYNNSKSWNHAQQSQSWPRN